MIPVFFSMYRQQVFSNASRNVWRYSKFFNLNWRFKKINSIFSASRGRNHVGKCILRTRGRLGMNVKIPRIAFFFHYLPLAFIADFVFIAGKNKFLSLIFFKTGALIYANAMSGQRLFSYGSWNRRLKRSRFAPSSWFKMLIQIRKLSFVSLIEMSPGRGAQYSRSTGSCSKIFSFDEVQRTALLQLPSKVKKTFSYFSMVGRNRLMGEENKFYRNTKSGYWRKLGWKGQVRGVAQNPVDHPHGGRTKSIKHQQTPWGKTTKLK